MNDVRRLRIKCEIEQIAAARERIAKIRDDEHRAISALSLPGASHQEITDLLSEAGHILLVVIGKLDKARK